MQRCAAACSGYAAGEAVGSGACDGISGSEHQELECAAQPDGGVCTSGRAGGPAHSNGSPASTVQHKGGCGDDGEHPDARRTCQSGGEMAGGAPTDALCWRPRDAKSS